MRYRYTVFVIHEGRYYEAIKSFEKKKDAKLYVKGLDTDKPVKIYRIKL